MKHKANVWVLGLQWLIALVVLLGLWQLLVSAKLLPSMAPNPIDVAVAIGDMLVSSRFWGALGQTLLASMVGWLISVVLGVALGLVFGTAKAVDESTSFLVEFGRAFPTIALMPVMMLLFGATFRMEVIMVVLAAVWPVLVQTVLGTRRLDAAVLDTVRIFRIPRSLWFRRVVLPSAFPFISTGVRIAASIAILVAVGVEVLTQVPGLGRLITLAQEAARWDQAFAYLFFAGAFGWLVTAVLSLAERSFLRWNRQTDD